MATVGLDGAHSVGAPIGFGKDMGKNIKKYKIRSSKITVYSDRQDGILHCVRYPLLDLLRLGCSLVLQVPACPSDEAHHKSKQFLFDPNVFRMHAFEPTARNLWPIHS